MRLFVEVRADDPRIVGFVREYPETTASASYALAELLSLAEQRGRNARVEELQKEIAERVKLEIREKTKALRNYSNNLQWASVELERLIESHAQFKAGMEAAKAAEGEPR